MAQYRPSFVDVSGLSQGIAQGFQKAMQIKQQTDLIVEREINDFQKNYNPEKLRTQDLGSFTRAFQNYKQSALQYSRLNRGGAKPEEIAVANELKDRALNEMSNMYSKSVAASSKQAEYADFIKTARLKGYSIPSNVNNAYAQLSSSSVMDIDVDNIPSAWSNKLVAEDVDFDSLNKYVDSVVGKQQGKSIRYEQGSYIGKSASGKDLYGTIPISTMYRDPNKTTASIEMYAPLHPEVDNAAKETYDQLFKGVKSGDSYSINKFNAIKSSLGLPKETPIENINKYQAFASTWYLPTTVEGAENFKAAEIAVASENEAFDRKVKVATLNQKNNQGSTFEHPSQTINKVTGNWQAYKSVTKNDVGFMPKANSVNVTGEFSSYTLPNDIGGKSAFGVVLYNPGGTGANGQVVQPFITYTTQSNPTVPIYSSLEQFNQLLVKSAPDVTFKGGQMINATAPPKVVSNTNTNVNENVSYSANGKTYTLPKSEEKEFLKSFPNAIKK
jgi:hypothetical protein